MNKIPKIELSSTKWRKFAQNIVCINPTRHEKNITPIIVNNHFLVLYEESEFSLSLDSDIVSFVISESNSLVVFEVTDTIVFVGYNSHDSKIYIHKSCSDEALIGAQINAVSIAPAMEISSGIILPRYKNTKQMRIRAVLM